MRPEAGFLNPQLPGFSAEADSELRRLDVADKGEFLPPKPRWALQSFRSLALWLFGSLARSLVRARTHTKRGPLFALPLPAPGGCCSSGDDARATWPTPQRVRRRKSTLLVDWRKLAIHLY